MILADTSIWIEHFRRGKPAFASALQENAILIHPVVIGELATDNLSDRKTTLSALQRLPRAKVATDSECLLLLEAHRLYGKGIGWSDIQLLASALLSKVPLWTLDARLGNAARRLGVVFA